MELLQLASIDRRRRAGHEVDGLCGFRERDDFADRRLTAEHGNDAVEAEGDAAVGRGAVLQRVEKESEPAFASSSEMPRSLKI